MWHAAARDPWSPRAGRAAIVDSARVSVQRAFVATSRAGDYDPRDVFWNLRASANLAAARGALGVARALDEATGADGSGLEAASSRLRDVIADVMPGYERRVGDPLPPLDVLERANRVLAAVEDDLDAELVGPPPRAAADTSPLHPAAHAAMLGRSLDAADIARRGAQLVQAGASSLDDAWAAWMKANHLAGIVDALACLQVPGASAFSSGLAHAQLAPALDAVELVVRAVREGAPAPADAVARAVEGFEALAATMQRLHEQLAARPPATA
jgi:hypothetical protein